jgi:hypothetical protein
MQTFAAELVRLAHAATQPEARLQLSEALRQALAILDAAPSPGACAAACPLVTRRVANALDGLAASLSMAADHAACVAERALSIAEPPTFQPDPRTPYPPAGM